MATILALAFTSCFTCYFMVHALLCDPAGQCLSGLQDETSLLQQSLLTSLVMDMGASSIGDDDSSHRHVSVVDHGSTENENEGGASMGLVTACTPGEIEFTPVELTGSGASTHGRIDKSGASICGVKGQLLGSGTNGDVYLGHPAAAPLPELAMKFPKDKLPADAARAKQVQDAFDHEVEVLVHLRKAPQHIVILYGFNPQERVLAMEPLLGGDLWKQKALFPLALANVKTLAENVLKGVADCHEHHVAHRDIKEEQFAFVRPLKATPASPEDWSTPLKLLDFGEAIEFDRGFMGFRKSSIKAWTHDELRGSPMWVSPEWAFNYLNRGKEKKFSAYAPDIWAVGVIVYHLATGKEFTAELFKQVESHAPQSSRSTWSSSSRFTSQYWRRIAEATDADIQSVIFHGFIQQQLAEASVGPPQATLASNFVERCLKKDPSHRMVTGSEEMTARELLKDPWFST